MKRLDIGQHALVQSCLRLTCGTIVQRLYIPSSVDKLSTMLLTASKHQLFLNIQMLLHRFKVSKQQLCLFNSNNVLSSSFFLFKRGLKAILDYLVFCLLTSLFSFGSSSALHSYQLILEHHQLMDSSWNIRCSRLILRSFLVLLHSCFITIRFISLNCFFFHA